MSKSVEKTKLRFVDDGAGDGDSLLLSAGQGIDLPVLKTVQVDKL